MTMGMRIAVDVDMLRQHRLGLMAEAEEIEAVARWRAARPLELRTSQVWLRLLRHAVAIDDAEPPVLDLRVNPPLERADR